MEGVDYAELVTQVDQANEVLAAYAFNGMWPLAPVAPYESEYNEFEKQRGYPLLQLDWYAYPKSEL